MFLESFKVTPREIILDFDATDDPLRLWFSSLAYTALAGTEMAQAICGTIRIKLFNKAAALKISVRHVVQLPTAFPFQEVFIKAWGALHRLPRPTQSAGAPLPLTTRQAGAIRTRG